MNGNHSLTKGSSSCWVMGSENIHDGEEDRIKERMFII